MKSSADVEREVEATRGQIDRTVEALKEKMQPGELFDEATRVMGSASNKVLTTVVDQARANPIPIALIGVGIAWLAFSQRRTASDEDFDGRGYYETYEGYDEHDGVRARLKAKAKATAEAARSKIAEAKEGFAEARSSAADGVSAARGRAAELTATAQARAGVYGRQAQARFEQTLQTEPLILAALGLAVGAAIGASLPSSRVERRYIGPTRDKLVDRGAELAKTSLDDAKGIAQRAYDQVKDELHRQTGPEGEGASLVEKAQAVAGAGVDAIRDEVDTRLPH